MQCSGRDEYHSMTFEAEYQTKDGPEIKRYALLKWQHVQLHSKSNPMNTQTIKISFACLAVLVSAACLRAGTITKNNNTVKLNLTTSWVGGVVPGGLDVAKWDSTVTSANSVALGADMSLGA